jgi:two-component system chemotaxis response regulator CheY
MNQLPDHIKKMNFLVTDDYASMRLLICEDLKKLGVTKIVTASSGNEALGIIKKRLGTPDEINFLLTDMMMPDGTGLELTKGIRALDMKNKLPILMISSIDDVGNMIECVKAGISNYVVKPWETDDFAKKIVDCIKK